MRLSFSDKQNEYIARADRRWNIKVGAVRSGKSFVDIAHVIPWRLRELKDESGLNVILGVSKETIERNVLQPMREIFTERLVGTINSRNIAQVCGVEVYCLGAEKVSQVAKIQGTSIKYCYGDEVAKWNREVFAMLQSRLDKPCSRFDGSCNPEHPAHWLKGFIDRPDIDAYVQKYTLFDNPYLPQTFVDNLCREYAGTVYYKRYVLGEWAMAEGLIYPMHEQATEPAQTAREGGFDRIGMSVDYGTQNAFAALLWGRRGDVWHVFDEYYYSGRESGTQKTDEEYCDELDRFAAPVLERLPYGAKLLTVIDPSAASFIAALQKRRYKIMKADNAVADGIRDTATAMQSGLIRISDGCVSLIRELQGYVWDEKAGDDTPLKINDHACDALRYFVKTMRIAEKGRARRLTDF